MATSGGDLTYGFVTYAPVTNEPGPEGVPHRDADHAPTGIFPPARGDRGRTPRGERPAFSQEWVRSWRDDQGVPRDGAQVSARPASRPWDRGAAPMPPRLSPRRRRHRAPSFGAALGLTVLNAF